MSEKINNHASDKESTMKTLDDGTKVWIDNERRCHRLDGPAIEWSNGSKFWWIHGNRHRADGPAIEGSDGLKTWWIHGTCHRVDGPAVERHDGSKSWYVHNKLIVRLIPKEKKK